MGQERTRVPSMSNKTARSGWSSRVGASIALTSGLRISSIESRSRSPSGRVPLPYPSPTPTVGGGAAATVL